MPMYASIILYFQCVVGVVVTCTHKNPTWILFTHTEKMNHLMATPSFRTTQPNMWVTSYETSNNNILSSRLHLHPNVSRVHVIYVCSYKHSVRGKISMIVSHKNSLSNVEITESHQYYEVFPVAYIFWIYYACIVLWEKGLTY